MTDGLVALYDIDLARKRIGSFRTTPGARTGLATYDFLLVIHSNHESISYHFWDKKQFWSKIAIIPTRVFKAPAEGVSLGILLFPSEFCNGGSAKK